MTGRILQYCCLRMIRRKGHIVVKLAFVILLALPAYVLLLNKTPSTGLTSGEDNSHGYGGADAAYHAVGEGVKPKQRFSPPHAPPQSRYSRNSPNELPPKDPHLQQQQRRRSLQDRYGDADTPKAPAAAAGPAGGGPQSTQPIIEASGIRGN